MEKENDEDNTIKSNISTGKLKKKIEENNELPWDVLDIIAKKLDFDGLFEFAPVCKSWRIFHKSYWSNFMASQAPLIIQTSFSMNDFSLFSIFEQKVVLNYRVKGFHFSGYSNGYMIMEGAANNKLLLVNPFTRRMKAISTLALKGNFPDIGCNTLLAFVKGSEDFIIVGLDKCYQSLHIYHSRNSCWVACLTQKKPRTIVGCLILHNTIYVITNKAEIGVLTLHTSSLKFLNLKTTPTRNNLFLKLVNYDEQLLVVDFEHKKRLNVYKIDFSIMAYVKLETLGEFALFYGWTRCYALSNPRRWGYDNNFVYYATGLNDGYEVYSGDKESTRCILPPTRLPSPAFRSRIFWMDWCFRHQRDEVDYSMAE